MNPRHIAALALIAVSSASCASSRPSWNLYLPPLEKGGGFDRKAPLSSWERYGSRVPPELPPILSQAFVYDDEQECLEGKTRWVEILARDADSRQAVLLARLKESRCIASDDPRLKEK